MTFFAGLMLVITASAQTGPFPPDAWPASAQADKAVHFVTVPTDGVPSLAPLSDTWVEGGMRILAGGDQDLVDISISGFAGKKASSTYFNVADRDYAFWNDYDTIDILMQVYGDGAVLSNDGKPRDFNFLIGTLPGPNLRAPSGGRLPVEAKNQRWNWVLFRIGNDFFDAANGFRRVGTKHPEAPGGSDFGGVNGGTIRLELVPNLIVRAVAWGEQGAFGEPSDVNQFLPPEGCDPEPETNLASIDLTSGVADHIRILNSGDQTSKVVEGVGPDTDKRKAAVALGSYLNFAVTDNYLGTSCNEPRTMKVCIDYFDDPALTGVDFGPEAYATDNKGAIGFVPASKREVLKGTGTWIRRSWVIPSVSLFGVNVAPLTAGPRFSFGGPVAISRFALGIFRVGNHPLAGQDPLADCFSDPLICTDTYGSFIEMDLASGNLNGLAPGDSGGDQVYVLEDAGPADDIRASIRPAFDSVQNGFQNNYLNFKITGQALGPNSQPNARLAICVTYYDDPGLIGKGFRPEVYKSERNGTVGFAFTSGSIARRLEGTGRWRHAYFELPDVNFEGVNQGPQAAARFVLDDKIHFSRVQYAVIRPCGPNAGVNLLDSCKGVTLSIAKSATGKFRFTWPVSEAGYTLETSSSVGADANWAPVGVDPTADGDNFVIELSPTATSYYRLSQ